MLIILHILHLRTTKENIVKMQRGSLLVLASISYPILILILSLFYPILSYPILSYPILPYPINFSIKNLHTKQILSSL